MLIIIYILFITIFKIKDIEYITFTKIILRNKQVVTFNAIYNHLKVLFSRNFTQI